jgi:hypothetical protein
MARQMTLAITGLEQIAQTLRGQEGEQFHDLAVLPALRQPSGQ